MSRSTHYRTEIARTVLVASLLVVTAFAGPASAGPFADFERDLAGAYAPYRTALFQTNQKDKAATEQALANFEARWSGLMKAYRQTPPPQYADDVKWPDTIAAIERVLAKAKGETGKGDLVAAHETLEAIRDELGALRRRNGVVVFSDRMDAYHEKMEETLLAKYNGFDAAGLAQARDNAAVLAYLAGQIERHTPASYKADQAYKEGLAAMIASIKALQDAARADDKPALEKAVKGLKAPYSKVFLRFG